MGNRGLIFLYIGYRILEINPFNYFKNKTTSLSPKRLGGEALVRVLTTKSMCRREAESHPCPVNL